MNIDLVRCFDIIFKLLIKKEFVNSDLSISQVMSENG
jgi:hypothetical protein